LSDLVAWNEQQTPEDIDTLNNGCVTTRESSFSINAFDNGLDVMKPAACDRATFYYITVYFPKR